MEVSNDDIEGFFLISFLSQKNIKSEKKINPAFKIRGYFKTLEEAQEGAKKLQEKDPYFDIFLGKMGHWMPFDPDVETVEEQIYREKELNELMSQYKKQQEEHNKLEEERRRQMKDSVKISKEDKQKENEKSLEEKKEKEKMNENYNRLKDVFEKLKKK